MTRIFLYMRAYITILFVFNMLCVSLTFFNSTIVGVREVREGIRGGWERVVGEGVVREVREGVVREVREGIRGGWGRVVRVGEGVVREVREGIRGGVRVVREVRE
jgi:hypothetical protein